MFIIKLDRSCNTPLYKQVYDHLKKMIDDGLLKPGDKLPSTRELSDYLAVNRTTVYKAYEELWAEGYIESRQGGYTTVRKKARLVIQKKITKKALINWEEKQNRGLLQILPVAGNRQKPEIGKQGNIDFIPLSPDPKLIPKTEFKKCINETIRESGPDVFQYGSEYGYTPLRNFIAKQMKLHGINVTDNEILITNGAQNAIELILKLFMKPHLKLVVENPTYSSVLPLFKYYNIELLDVPMTDDGMDIFALESILQQEKPDLIYTMPNFQNPTGITTSQAHREKLISLCEKYKIPLIEDGFVEELKYFGKNILPIKSMDKYGIVFYVGTFSKVLFPGLRIGWIAANAECIKKLSVIKKACEIAGNALNQAALNRFCNKGLYELHIKKFHKIYKKRMQIALKIIRENLINKNITYTKPIGGYTIWFEVNKSGIKEEELVKTIEDSGVSVIPGKLFYSKQHKQAHFRISIAHRTEIEIDEGMKKIVNVLNNLK